MKKLICSIVFTILLSSFAGAAERTEKRVPWCAKDSLACPSGWRCSDVRVPNTVLGLETAPNDPNHTGWDGPDCGKGGADDATCPRYCKRDSRTPWCAKNSLECPSGWLCSERRVPNSILALETAPNDPGHTGWDGPDCGKGRSDDATCPRYCTRR